MSQKVLSYDLGGTKIAVGVIHRSGRIIDEIRAPAEFHKGKAAVLKKLIELGKTFLEHHPDITQVGMASAGPLDPIRGLLLSPTNFSTKTEKWKNVPIVKILSTHLKRKVRLENDAAAAVLAEHWMGSAKKIQNIMVLTLGTGLGTGVICNGNLVRSGRNLHPEAGHMIINYQDQTAPCGCGSYGCAEAYLSGKYFSQRTAIKLRKPSLTGSEIAQLARTGNRIALQAFDEYSTLMAVALLTYTRLYAPETVVFTGSFADASDLFLPATRKKLRAMLKRQKGGLEWMPRLELSSLDNRAGLLGGAYVAFQR